MREVFFIGFILLFIFQTTYFFSRISTLNTNFNTNSAELAKATKEFVTSNTLEAKINDYQERMMKLMKQSLEELKEEIHHMQGQNKYIESLEKHILRIEEQSPYTKRDQVDNVFTTKHNSESLSKLVRDHLFKIQFPSDCETAKLLVCDIPNGCGFGCQVHKIAYCQYAAYAMGRAMVLQDKLWNYMQKNDLENCKWEKSGTRPFGFNWECVFAPPSKCKVSQIDYTGAPDFNGWDDEKTMNARVIRYDMYPNKYEKFFNKNTHFMYAYWVPRELEPEIKKFHSDPPVWFLGQIVTFLLRPNALVQKHIQEVKKEIGYGHLIAGMHIRRTDKVGFESVEQPLGKYMEPIDDFFKAKLPPGYHGKPKLVFVSTDDASQINQLESLFPEFKFIHQPFGTHSLLTMDKRYSGSELVRLITDIHLLAECDLFVGSFSSQISRIVYELMQLKFPDTPREKVALSVDGGWFSGAGIQTGLYKELIKKEGNA